jgi:hypothetical protein
MDEGELRTAHSVKAATLSENFRGSVGRMKVGPGYVPDLTAPDGQSTGGGAHALQHLRLVPPAPDMPTLVVGHANQPQGTAVLRTWEHVDAICRERFENGSPVDASQYEQFLRAAQTFLESFEMRVTFAPTPRSLAPRATPTPQPAIARAPLSMVLIAVIGVLCVLVAVLTFKLLARN